MILLWNNWGCVSIMKTLLMGQLNVTVNNPSTLLRGRAGVRRMVKHNPKTDMTPMVDLGFLLITFFVITAELSKPTMADLYMPKDGPPIPVANSKTLNVLLGRNNAVFYYQGNWGEAIKTKQILETNFSYIKGIGEVIVKNNNGSM
jgi:biopolymer transport protein ExbD